MNIALIVRKTTNKAICSLILTKFSTRKFYQIINQHNIQPLPEIPEDAVLSKYLADKQSMTGKNKSTSDTFTKFQKQKQTKLNYNQLLAGSPYGSVLTLTHRNHQITLISTNYFRIDQRKFHKVLYAAQPDAIVIQRRPQYHLPNFQLLPKGPDGVFSDRQYLNQLQFTSESIVKPSQVQTMRPIHDAFNRNKNDLLQKNPNKETLQEKGFELSKKYSASYQIPMYFGQMPIRTYRQWLANNHTLMQLQQIFKVVCQRLPRYQHISLTPYQMATFIHPEIFLKLNDVYMATILEMLISTKRYRKIVGVFGIMQNQAVKFNLQKNQSLKPIIQYLVPPGPKGTIVRDIQNLQVIQKHILIDVLFNGRNTANIKLQDFYTTNAVIEKYGKQIDRKVMLKFRYDKVTQYLQILEEKYAAGETEIKKQFVRQTLRNNDIKK